MLTLFTTAKPFKGHIGVIQRNALQSWKLLHPDVEVILFGDDEGAADVARELGLCHEPYAERDPSGLKYIHSMFDRANGIARHDILCYVNCDIILTPDILDALRLVRDKTGEFLMVGRRWDTNITQPLDFINRGWQKETRHLAQETNNQRDEWWIDYFVFSRGLFYKKIPPFVIGRVCWDNWLVWKALQSQATVVDASSVVFPIHQNHSYSYHPDGEQGVWNDQLSQRNLALAGGWLHLRTIFDANSRLSPAGLTSNPKRYWYAARRMSRLLYRQAKRVLTYKVWLPVWHFSLDLTRPLRTRLGLRSPGQKNSSHAGTLP